MRAETGAAETTWLTLGEDERRALTRKLENLYGFAADREAFDALAEDKRRALRLVFGRLRSHGLDRHVRRVENVYGCGGVGMGFIHWPGLRRTLNQHPAFRHSLIARRGFRERGRRRAALHFLEGPRAWSVHFDLENPISSVSGLWHHLRREVWRGQSPDWAAIDKALREG